MAGIKNQWKPRIINVMANGCRVDDIAGYMIPKNSGYYRAIRKINKEQHNV